MNEVSQILELSIRIAKLYKTLEDNLKVGEADDHDVLLDSKEILEQAFSSYINCLKITLFQDNEVDNKEIL